MEPKNCQLTAVDLHFLVKELQAAVNSKIDKIYQLDNSFIFSLHSASLGRSYLKALLPYVVFLTGYKGNVPERPSEFCIFLRKHLVNARIREIRQYKGERVLELFLETKENRLKLIIELFSNGNLILCDSENKIKSALITKKWKDRTIRGNIAYSYPEKRYSFKEIAKEELYKLLSEPKRESIVKALAIDLGLGGPYAEELCFRSGVDKSKKKADKKDADALFDKLREMLSEQIKANKAENRIYPIELKTQKPEKLYNSFNSALDEELSEAIATGQKNEKLKSWQKKISSIKKILEKQEADIEKFKREHDEAKRKGELIFENYAAIKEILDELNKAMKKYSLKDIKEKLKGHKTIKELNEKEKAIVIEL